jgi:hypothetical protein
MNQGTPPSNDRVRAVTPGFLQINGLRQIRPEITEAAGAADGSWQRQI